MSPIPWQTPEEARFVKESVLLPMILDVLERDRAAVVRAELKLPEIYDDLIDSLQKAAMEELSQARQGLRQHGMKIYKERRTVLGVEASYLCRGYHYEFSMLWGLVKAEILQRIRSYLSVSSVGFPEVNDAKEGDGS